MWWKSAVNCSFFLCLAACRMRSSACDTLTRLCVRRVLCWPAFPLAPALRSTNSAADRSALFAGFTATTAGSDFSRSVHHRLRLLAFPMRALGQRAHRSSVRPPGSRARSVRTCQGLRPRRAERALAFVAPSRIAFRSVNGVGARDECLSRLNGWPMRSPTDASPTPSRTPAHGSGPMWIATPSSQWTFTTYSLPVSRRHF